MDKIPYIVHEADMSRMERINKRIMIVCVILIVLLFSSNFAWICYDKQFENSTTTYTQEADVDTGSGNAFINNGGDMNYGESQDKTDSNN